MYDVAVVRTNSQLNMIDINDAHFDSGDIIMFRYDCSKCSIQDYYNMLITCRPWPEIYSHIGMVIVLEGIPYIAHMTFCERYNPDGSCLINRSGIIPLYEYLDNYKGNVYHSKFKTNLQTAYEMTFEQYLSDFNKKLYNRMLELNKLEFYVDPITVFDYQMTTDIANRRDRATTCSGYIQQLLVDMDILPPNYKGINRNHSTPSQVFIDALKTGHYTKPNIIINGYIRKNYL